jgi:HSP20 family protein
VAQTSTRRHDNPSRSCVSSTEHHPVLAEKEVRIMFSLTTRRNARDGSGALTRAEHPLDLFRRDMDTLFDRFFGRWPEMREFDEGMGLDVRETDKEVQIDIDAAGLEAGDFAIQVKDNDLRVVAERKEGEEGKEGFRHRRLTREVTLSSGVDPETVESHYRNGVLELRLSKTEQAQWKKIEVKSV